MITPINFLAIYLLSIALLAVTVVAKPEWGQRPMAVAVSFWLLLIATAALFA